MPIRFWSHPCCRAQRGARVCTTHGSVATEARWLLSMHEAMLRYQLRYGWLPVGPHRQLADALVRSAGDRCLPCKGSGLIERDGGSWCEACPSCQGFGHGPFPGDPAILAARARVATECPDALTRYEPADAGRRLVSVLTGDAGVAQDLGTGEMVSGGGRPAGGTE